MKIYILSFLLSFMTSLTWTENQLIAPEELASLIKSGKKPLILNTGPMGNIKGAVRTGPASTEDGLLSIHKTLTGVSKKRLIVVYCGCCKPDNCPNIKPAYDYIYKSGYTKVKALNLPVGFEEDWKAKGYPVE